MQTPLIHFQRLRYLHVSDELLMWFYVLHVLGRRFALSGGSLSPPGSLLVTDRAKAVVLV